jgi:hypothetical protein
MIQNPREISPELVLVDPELARLARASLGEPGSFGTPSPQSGPRLRLVVDVPPSPAGRGAARHGGDARTMLALLAVVALVGIGALTIGKAFTWVGSHGGRHPTAAAKSPAFPESHGQSVLTPAARRLTWPRVPAASYYDFILWYDGRRILDEWPNEPQSTVPVAWSFRGVAYTLVPGRYNWFAYAGFGAKAARHYGALAGSGVLVVPNAEGH